MNLLIAQCRVMAVGKAEGFSPSICHDSFHGYRESFGHRAAQQNVSHIQ
jgi:hypothetical protein